MTILATYYGKYRGIVLNNQDPELMGRLMVQVPDVSNLSPITWAMPCLPLAGVQHGTFMLPTVGSGVWVEFEQGDAQRPIWTGCYWGSASELPALAYATPAFQQILLQTEGQNLIQVNDLAGPTGGITLKTAEGAMILINSDGITITNGQGATIMLTGPSVNVNDGALQIT